MSPKTLYSTSHFWICPLTGQGSFSLGHLKETAKDPKTVVSGGVVRREIRLTKRRLPSKRTLGGEPVPNTTGISRPRQEMQRQRLIKIKMEVCISGCVFSSLVYELENSQGDVVRESFLAISKSYFHNLTSSLSCCSRRGSY